MFDKLSDSFMARFKMNCDRCKVRSATIRLWGDPDSYYCQECTYIVGQEIKEQIDKDLKEFCRAEDRQDRKEAE